MVMFSTTTLFILIGVCIWVLGIYKLNVHEVLIGSLEFSLSRLWLRYLLLSLFAWCNRRVTCYGWNMFNDFRLGKWKWILYVINEYFIWYLYFLYVVEAFTSLLWKTKYKFTSPFPSLPLVRIHSFCSTIFLYIGGLTS